MNGISGISELTDFFPDPPPSPTLMPAMALLGLRERRPARRERGYPRSVASGHLALVEVDLRAVVDDQVDHLDGGSVDVVEQLLRLVVVRSEADQRDDRGDQTERRAVHRFR